ncbi:Protein of uncharacterised function (DUF2474) [Enterobacter hormaechei]|jgi:hypothetical protein|nr:Protein of uncharacterised function (DUF2474) [Enterobacter hormaechei]VAM34252.1 Protein of uncharacterised function (DUF2474) [Enterobacter hormaechei]
MAITLEKTSMKTVDETPRPFWKKLMWLVIIWAASVMALGVVATIFKLLMTAAGMKTH